MRLLFESSQVYSDQVVNVFLAGGHYRDVFISQIKEKSLDLPRIVNFLQNYKNKNLEKMEKKELSKEDLLQRLSLLKAEKRKIFSKIAKNQNKGAIIPCAAVVDKKVTYMSKRR